MSNPALGFGLASAPPSTYSQRPPLVRSLLFRPRVAPGGTAPARLIVSPHLDAAAPAAPSRTRALVPARLALQPGAAQPAGRWRRSCLLACGWRASTRACLSSSQRSVPGGAFALVNVHALDARPRAERHLGVATGDSRHVEPAQPRSSARTAAAASHLARACARVCVRARPSPRDRPLPRPRRRRPGPGAAPPARSRGQPRHGSAAGRGSRSNARAPSNNRYRAHQA